MGWWQVCLSPWPSSQVSSVTIIIVVSPRVPTIVTKLCLGVSVSLWCLIPCYGSNITDNSLPLSEYHNPFPSKVWARQNTNVCTNYSTIFIDKCQNWNHSSSVFGQMDLCSTASLVTGLAQCSLPRIFWSETGAGAGGGRAQAREMLVNTEPGP